MTRHPFSNKVRFGMRFYVDVDSDKGFHIHSDSPIRDRGPESATVKTVAEIGLAMQKIVEHNIEALKRNAQKNIDKANETKEAADALLGRLSR